MVLWATQLVNFLSTSWKYKKAYKNSGEVVQQYNTLVDVFSRRSFEDISKFWFTQFVVDQYFKTEGAQKSPEDVKRLTNAVFTMMKYDGRSFMDVIRSVNTKDMDVQKATLVAIDFIGELVNVEDQMDLLLFQDIVYGINRILLQLKKGDTDKKTAYKIGQTLWRMHQIAKIYKEQKNNQGLTKEQFEAKLMKYMGEFRKVL